MNVAFRHRCLYGIEVCAFEQIIILCNPIFTFSLLIVYNIYLLIVINIVIFLVIIIRCECQIYLYILFFFSFMMNMNNNFFKLFNMITVVVDN